MKRMGAAFMGVAALAAAAIACGSFSSDGAPTDGSDASNDATNDAAVSDVALVDGPIQVDAGKMGFCAASAGMHDLCEDFDEAPLAADSWEPGAQTTPDAGIAQLDQGRANSPPSSLLVGLSTVGTKGQRSFFLHRNIAKPAMKKIVLSFDLFVDTLEATDAGFRPDALVAGIGDGIYNTQIRIANDNGQLVVGVEEVLPTTGGYYDPVYSFGNHTFAVGLWHHFVLTSDRANNVVSLTIDGTTGAPPAATPFHAPKTEAMNLGLDLGAQTDQSTETIEHHFDNVTLDLDR